MQKGSITFHYKPKKKIVYKLDNEKLEADTKLSKKARSNLASKFKRDNNKTKILENHIERTKNSDNSIFINNTQSNTSFLKKKRKKNESVTKTKIVNSNLYHKDAAKSKISTSEIKKSKKKSRKTKNAKIKKLITLMKTPSKTNLRNIVFESEDNYNSNHFSTIQSTVFE